MIPLVGHTSLELEQMLSEMGEPAFRGRQVARWLYRRNASSFEEMTDLPATLRWELGRHYAVRTLSVTRESRAPDGTVKLACRLVDGAEIETVYLPYEDRVSACLSSQVGCPAACTFCATGQMGFARNLTAGEMVEQYLLLSSTFPNRRISHVVFMGMGEPLLNMSNLPRALRLLTREVGLSARRITVSTVGVVPGIRQLAQEGVQVGLAISIHAPDDALREQIVPLAQRWRLAEILDAVRAYREQTGRDPTFEYLLLGGINDSPEHARRLVRLLGDLPGAVNLIPWNPVQGLTRLRSPDRRAVERFRAVLEEAGRTVTERRRRGRGVRAACGQLATGTKEGGRRDSALRQGE